MLSAQIAVTSPGMFGMVVMKAARLLLYDKPGGVKPCEPAKFYPCDYGFCSF